jgi:fermentation-respiration switch protein FrsA (DUF1100 family)
MEHVQDSQQSASGVRMREVLFDSGGVLCAADLYLPGKKTGPVPCVVMGHGGSGTKRLGLPAYAEKFAAGGLAAFVFDYRGFGASGGEPRQVIDVDAQREDYLAAVGYIRALAEVDPQRIAVWGTSLSGGHVLAVADADPAIAAVVSQVPMIDGMHRGRTLRQRLNWEVTGHTLQFTVAVRDLLRARRGQPPYYVPVVAPPGQVAVFTEPEARATFEALGGQACGWRNELAPRFVFALPKYAAGYRRSPVDAAAHVPGRPRPSVPGDVQPVPGAAADGELPGFDPVVDDAGAAAELAGGFGDADLAAAGSGERGCRERAGVAARPRWAD